MKKNLSLLVASAAVALVNLGHCGSLTEYSFTNPLRAQPWWYEEKSDGNVSETLNAGGLTANEDESQKIVWQQSNAVYSVVSSFLRPSGEESDAAVSLSSLVIGSPQGEALYDYRIGEYCQPPEDFADMIDWSKTLANLKSSEAYTNGQIHVFNNGSPTNCILFTDCNTTVAIEWVLNDSDHSTTQSVYRVGIPVTEHQHRLYWTSAPHNGPTVSFGSAKFVRLYGPKSVIPEDYDYDPTRATNGVPVTKSGVRLNLATMQLTAETDRSGTGQEPSYDGPEGYFVVAYYDSGNYDRLLGTIVVQVSGPDVNVLKANVGDELKPHGGGSNIKDLSFVVNRGLADGITSAGSNLGDNPFPCLTVFQNNSTVKSTSKLFAFAPNDAASSPKAQGVDSPQDADVYWKSSDFMDVSWPFENSQYLISWGSDETMPMALVGDAKDNADGVDIVFPSAYQMELSYFQGDTNGVFIKETDSLIAENLSANLPTASDSSITTNSAIRMKGEGYFAVKLSTQNNAWVIPVHVVSHKDTKWFSRAPVNWYAGTEITPVAEEASGVSLLAGLNPYIRDVDQSLPGFIYTNKSARIWNTRLYHAPDNAFHLNNTEDSQQTTSIDNLKSSIYAVSTYDSTGNRNIEVWWYTKLLKDGMPEHIALPALPQCYHILKPRREDIHTIALASQLGSNEKMRSANGKAMWVNQPEAYARMQSPVSIPIDKTGFTLGFWVNILPDVGPNGSFGAGHLASFCSEDANNRFSALIDVKTNFYFQLVVNGEKFQESTRWPLEKITKGWGAFAVSFVPTEEESVYDMTCWFAREGWATNTEPKLVRMPAGLAKGFNAVNIGRFLTWPAARGYALDNVFAFRFGIRDEKHIRDLVTLPSEANPDFDKMMVYFDFDSADDLSVSSDYEGDYRNVRDLATGGTMKTYRMMSISPGAPSLSTGLLYENDGVVPEIYYQNDKNKPGYKPNFEHAIVHNTGNGYSVYPIRCDLNSLATSDEMWTEPIVLAMYNDNGKGAMKAYYVVATNSVWPTFSSTGTVGTVISGPRPLDYLPWHDNDRNFVKQLANTNDLDTLSIYRDHNMRMWSRAPGEVFRYVYYPVQEGFAFPEGYGSKPEVGDLVPWMSRFGEALEAGGSEPHYWRYVYEWPDPSSISEMKIGQTLSTAKDGLPEVANASSMQVVFPLQSKYVKLIDPTVARTCFHAVFPLQSKYVKLIDKIALIDRNGFPESYGFTLGDSGTCRIKGGKYYFQNLPPNISSRFYVDLTQEAGKEVQLIGSDTSSKADGSGFLAVNILTDEERQQLKEICKTTDAAKKENWDEIIDALAIGAVEPSIFDETTVFTNEVISVTNSESTVTNRVLVKDMVTYECFDLIPRDSYALVASGESWTNNGYVVLAENDSADTSMVADGSPISLKILRVAPKLYTGKLLALQDENNKISEKLSIVYGEPIQAAGEGFKFEWVRKSASDGDSEPVDDSYKPYISGENLTSFTLGTNGASLAELVNTYYTMRYSPTNDALIAILQANNPDKNPDERKYSDWCKPTLAEGWVQRVLNNVTPFAQRLDDFSANAAEVALTMPEQIGGPYQGDVALNQDNLANVGLIQLYQTVLNRAESLSLRIGIQDAGANEQLLLAASRLADLYSILGAEAYSDAMNPTISASAGSDVEWKVSDAYKSLPSSMFSFANQVDSLLDEELALLRGRGVSSTSNESSMQNWPYYNRLIWNFTKGVTEGEVAYVLNYGINGKDGVIDSSVAATQYPQGHGDAWGHYLDAVWGYYRLLRNPNYEWGSKAVGEMLISQHIVREDYEDEQKFASAAERMATIGARVVDLTARKYWRDSDGADITGGYLDSENNNTNSYPQGFGYGEWANRACLAAFWNWATVNSLTPTNGAPGAFNDETLSRVNRSTVPALYSIASAYADIERTVQQVESGETPLGLSVNAVPFDMDSSSSKTQFEQVLDRAKKALRNAGAVLEYADQYGSRIAALKDVEGDVADEIAKTEQAYNEQLIAIYGTPYAGDIGPGGTYEQGYEGPDIYHYMWVDYSDVGVDFDYSTVVTNYKITFANFKGGLYNAADVDGTFFEKKLCTVDYALSSSGMIVKPKRITGSRRAEGEIQAAYREYLDAYLAVVGGFKALAKAQDDLDRTSDLVSFQYGKAIWNLTAKETLAGIDFLNWVFKVRLDILLSGVTNVTLIARNETLSVADLASVTVGMASDIGKIPARMTYNQIVQLGNQIDREAINSANRALTVLDWIKNIATATVTTMELSMNLEETRRNLENSLRSACLSTASAATNLRDAFVTLSKAEQNYLTAIEKGAGVQREREVWRKAMSNTNTKYRYADMYYRVQRNAALAKYNTAFDTAQKYVYQLAKTYDYETGLLSSDKRSGNRFLGEIIGTRALGAEGVSIGAITPGVDGGLWDIVNRMEANWDVLKGRLGINNPEKSAIWFSLRKELFRIAGDESGDAAWRRELRKYWVDDLKANDEFRRYCQMPASESGLSAKLPGLIIPFTTSVNAGENFFGKALLAGDSQFYSPDFATKISCAGITFDNYPDSLLAQTPGVYLVPVGMDKFRSPDDSREVLEYEVVDQVLPLPYQIGSTALDKTDYSAFAYGVSGDVKIRRHSMMRANTGEIASSRLQYRSVWNTRWLLVIPGISLRADGAAGLEQFIAGADLNGDGKADVPGVSDIKLGIKAFSRSGN